MRKDGPFELGRIMLSPGSLSESNCYNITKSAKQELEALKSDIFGQQSNMKVHLDPKFILGFNFSEINCMP